MISDALGVILCIFVSGRDIRWGHYVCFFHMKPPSSHQMTHRWNHRRDRNFDVFRVIRHKLMIMMAIGPMILMKPQSWDSQVWKSHNFDVIWSIGLRVIKSVPNLSQRCLSFSHFTGLHLKSGLYNCLINKTTKAVKTALSIEVAILAWVSFLFSRRYKGPDPWTKCLSPFRPLRSLSWLITPSSVFGASLSCLRVVSPLQFQSTSAPSAIFLTRLPLKFCSLVKSDHSWPSLSHRAICSHRT